MKNWKISERNRNKISIGLLSGLLAAGLIAGGVNMVLEREAKETSGEGFLEESADSESGAAQIDAMETIDDVSIYEADLPYSVVHFYVTVRYGSEGKGTNHTFAEVNHVVRFENGAHVENDVFAEALVQVGDANGPVAGMLGYGETASNATIRVRGSSSTAAAVKSYKLSLDEGAGTWRGQSNIALNKHAYDVTKFRNKLYFDILKDIPEVPSLRTQFVELHIKDETSGETEFKSYGLYTQAEVPTKKYLKNHGMDSSGYLYKVIGFNWEKNAAIKNIDDPAYDATAMETVISNRGREDNGKLIELIEAVNDVSIDINYILDTYFDRDNYVTWLAYNILMGNIDTTMQNYYLYSPLNGNKWYFIPWDGDASLYGTQNQIKGATGVSDWECGISNYWSVLLHNRYLKYATNREELKNKVEELKAMMTEEYLLEKIQEYDKIAGYYTLQAPDYLYLGVTAEERNYVVSRLTTDLQINYDKFLQSLEALMPFWMFEPQVTEDSVLLHWGEAYDFSARKIEYNLLVSRYPDMSQPVIEETALDELGYRISRSELGEGTFYMKVVAVSQDGRTTGACNEIEVNDTDYLGVMSFTIQ